MHKIFSYLKGIGNYNFFGDCFEMNVHQDYSYFDESNQNGPKDYEPSSNDYYHILFGNGDGELHLLNLYIEEANYSEECINFILH